MKNSFWNCLGTERAITDTTNSAIPESPKRTMYYEREKTGREGKEGEAEEEEGNQIKEVELRNNYVHLIHTFFCI